MISGKKQAAFTLMEIMIVSVIIATLAMMFGKQIQRRYEAVRKNQTITQLGQIREAVLEYQLANQKLPTKMEDLYPYLNKAEPPKDSWGGDIIFERPPREHPKEYKRFEIYSTNEEYEDLHTGQ